MMSSVTRSLSIASPSRLAMAWTQTLRLVQYKISLSKLLQSHFFLKFTIAGFRYRKVISYFEDAHTNKYKFVVGGDVNPNPTDGLYIPISIIDNPPEDSKVVREEPFGPIVPLLKWSDEKDVIKRASE